MSDENVITELVEKMTLEEKAGLCSGDDYWHTKGIPRLGIKRAMLTDGPHGLRRQVGKADHLGLNQSVPSTCYPAGATAANSWDTELITQMGSWIAEEAAAEGVSVVLGPALNIKRNPLCGRNFEYYSEDPFLSGKLAAAYIRGIQAKGLAACPKHFAVNNQERLRMVIDALVDERTLREIYLLPFEYAVKEGGAKTIMTSYNRVNGEYATESPHLLEEILHREWGFSGVVISDWGASNDRVSGLKAGNHLEMPSTGGESDEEIIQAIRSGRIGEELLDQRVRALLRLIRETAPAVEEGRDYSREEHHRHAQEIAEKSMVLLKNNGSILPLAPGTRCAVIGDFAETPRYQGAGSSIINPTRLISPLEALKASELEITGYEPGFHRFGKRSERKKERALALARRSDTVLLFLGLDESTEAEGLDREKMALPENQIDLLRALSRINRRLVVVLAGGAPVTTPWDAEVQALLHGYLGGQAGGAAIARILTGEVNPSGKLAETYPHRYEDIASSAYFPGREKTVEHREGLYVGYRYFDKAGSAPKYPFGYGLSYTSFAYSDLKADQPGAEFFVTNTGKRRGAEICQLYIGAEESRLFRPERELKGFARIELEPGEAKRVRIDLDDKAFAYYNTAAKSWMVDPGRYQIAVGPSSRDLPLRESLTILGDGGPVPYSRKLFPSYYSGNVANMESAEFQRLLGRPLPDPHWDPAERIGANTSILESAGHKGLGAFLYGLIRFLQPFCRYNLKKSTALQASLFMPYRSLVKMTQGLINTPMLEGILTMANRRFFKGTAQFVRAWKKRRREQ